MAVSQPQQPELVAYRHRVTKEMSQTRVEDGPKRDFKRFGIIEGYMRINGHKAHVLLDSGSTLDLVSASFAKVHKLDVFQLKNLIQLQMATSRSHSTIACGAKAELQIGDHREGRYFDIVNLDRYQVILGTLFLKQHGILLNYTGSGSFKLGQKWFPMKEGDFSWPSSLRKEGESAGIAVSTSSKEKEGPKASPSKPPGRQKH